MYVRHRQFRLANTGAGWFVAMPIEGRDRDICKLLGTNASELEYLLGKSRQTIAKHIDRDEFFGVDEIVQVAAKKMPNEIERSQVISEIVKKYFPDLLKYTRDLDVLRFSIYCVSGMHIYADIKSNRALECFLTSVLEDPRKFVLFICLPEKDYVQLCKWLEHFTSDRKHKMAAFVVMPCKLVELAPIQILAEPWSNDPQLIQVDQSALFVDSSNSYRACKLANALRELGAQKCESINESVDGQRIIQEFNTSYYDDAPLPEKPFGSYLIRFSE